MLQYQAGTTKGATIQGDLFNDPFQLGNVDSTYTSNAVVETLSSAITNVSSLAFNPVKKLWKETDGSWVEVSIGEDGTIASTTGKVKYLYDNVVIPQGTVPTLKAELKGITLQAKARRIAVYYSQIAAFQAQTDYGFSLGDQLAEKAVGQLNYEIDTEVVECVANAAGDVDEELTWSKTLPIGVSKAEHYEGFSEIIEIGKQKIYDATKRFAPNYMLISSSVLPVLTFMKGFQAAPITQINGPYFAGTLNGLKVFVSPAMTAGEFVLGVNGEDMMSSVAVYAPYMPVIPTQLLQFADGATSQGFSTMYDLQVLNENLAVKGMITA